MENGDQKIDSFHLTPNDCEMSTYGFVKGGFSLHNLYLQNNHWIFARLVILCAIILWISNQHIISQGWGQIRFIKYKYKYKYKNLDFSNTNTNINIFFNFNSNTNTNTNTSIHIQIQIQIRSTQYICRNCSGSKIGQFYKSQDIYTLMACVSLCLSDTWSFTLLHFKKFHWH